MYSTVYKITFVKSPINVEKENEDTIYTMENPNDTKYYIEAHSSKFLIRFGKHKL